MSIASNERCWLFFLLNWLSLRAGRSLPLDTGSSHQSSTSPIGQARMQTNNQR